MTSIIRNGLSDCKPAPDYLGIGVIATVAGVGIAVPMFMNTDNARLTPVRASGSDDTDDSSGVHV